MEINATPPLLDGSELGRDAFFGSKDQERKLPIETHPFHERVQENQNRDGHTSPVIKMGCTVFTYLDIVEAKGFWETGEWWQVEKNEFDRLWRKIVSAGYGSDTGGAYLNGINKVMEDPSESVLLVQKNSDKQLRFKQSDWFYVANRSDSVEEFTRKVMMEIAYGQGVQVGVNTKTSRLGYVEADKAPYTIVANDKPIEIAHAFPLSSYGSDGIICSSGVSGDDFGDKGVVYIDPLLTRKLFTPIGFTGTFTKS
jgi:hypothetical protein